MKNDNNQKLFDVGLIETDRNGNNIFTLGVIIIYIALNRREQTLLQPETSQASNLHSYQFQKSLASANWIFLIAAIIFFNTASASLNRKITDLPENVSSSDIKNIKGSKMVAGGNFLRVIGYLLTAIGRETIAGSIG